MTGQANYSYFHIGSKPIYLSYQIKLLFIFLRYLVFKKSNSSDLLLAYFTEVGGQLTEN
jgi:hypothetical protein